MWFIRSPWWSMVNRCFIESLHLGRSRNRRPIHCRPHSPSSSHRLVCRSLYVDLCFDLSTLIFSSTFFTVDLFTVDLFTSSSGLSTFSQPSTFLLTIDFILNRSSMMSTSVLCRVLWQFLLVILFDLFLFDLFFPCDKMLVIIDT